MPRRSDQSDGSNRRVQENPVTPAPSLCPDASILAPEIQTRLCRLNGTYDPFYCVAVLALMSQGASIAEVSLRLRVPFSRLKQWRDEHEEFRLAFEDGAAYAFGWWEAMGRANITDKNFNSTLWLMQMVNRFGYVRGDVGGVGGGGNQPSQITFTKDVHNHLHSGCDLTKCSKDELETMANALRKARGGSSISAGFHVTDVKAIACKAEKKK